MRIAATRSLFTAPGDDRGIGCVVLYTLGLGEKIIPGVRLDQKSFHTELPVATQARKKKESRWWSRRAVSVAVKIVELIVMSE